MTKFFLIPVLALLQSACGGSGGNSEAIDPGLYFGAAVYRNDGEPMGGCLDYVKQCFMLSQVEIHQQYSSDGASELLVVSNFGSKVLGRGEAGASVINFSETLENIGPCGNAGGDIYCTGLREARIESVSQSERVLRLEGQVTASCASAAGTFQCTVGEEAELQG